MIVADESILRPNLDVAVVSISVDEDGADRRLVGIADRQSFESVTSHQFIARFGGKSGFRIGIDDAGSNERVFHVMPALLLRIGVRALLGERRGARQFWIESRIDFRERMNNRLLPITMNDLDRCDLAGRVAIDKFLRGFLKSVSANGGSKKGEASRS